MRAFQHCFFSVAFTHFRKLEEAVLILALSKLFVIRTIIQRYKYNWVINLYIRLIYLHLG